MLIALSLAVGVAAGGGAVGFRELIQLLTRAFTGHSEPGALGHFTNPHLAFLGPYVVLVLPVLGGLIYGPLISRFAPEAKGHGVPEVMYAVHAGEGRIRARVPAVKALASALCIGSGGSVGLVGPVIQIGAAFGSGLGQLGAVTVANRRLLVACGAAGGVAALFNAPIGGVFLALELILRDFRARSVGVVLLSSFVATLIGRLAFGSATFLSLPDYHVISAAEYPFYALLGLAAALAGVCFIRVLESMEVLADRLWSGPAWLRPAAGGVLLGALLLALPQMYGVGFAVVTRALEGQYVLGALLVFMAAKILATSLTLSIGGSGGVFAPSLFIGAMLGCAFGLGVHAVLPGQDGPVGAYGIVGMAAVFAAAGRVPLASVAMAFEVTGDYAIVLPLILAVVAATVVSQKLSRDSIYTSGLRRRGLDLEAGRSSN